LIILITTLLKSFFHFRFLRIKQGKRGNFADYTNVGFSMKKGINYIEIVLPIPITVKEESEQLENLRKKVNSLLIVIYIAFITIITSLIIISS